MKQLLFVHHIVTIWVCIWSGKTWPTPVSLSVCYSFIIQVATDEAANPNNKNENLFAFVGKLSLVLLMKYIFFAFPTRLFSSFFVELHTLSHTEGTISYFTWGLQLVSMLCRRCILAIKWIKYCRRHSIFSQFRAFVPILLCASLRLPSHLISWLFLRMPENDAKSNARKTHPSISTRKFMPSAKAYISQFASIASNPYQIVNEFPCFKTIRRNGLSHSIAARCITE